MNKLISLETCCLHIYRLQGQMLFALGLNYSDRTEWGRQKRLVCFGWKSLFCSAIIYTSIKKKTWLDSIISFGFTYILRNRNSASRASLPSKEIFCMRTQSCFLWQCVCGKLIELYSQVTTSHIFTVLTELKFTQIHQAGFIMIYWRMSIQLGIDPTEAHPLK